MLQETLFKPPYTFFSQKCQDCIMRRLCVKATAFNVGDRSYLLDLHHRKPRVETEAMLEGKKAHEKAEESFPTAEEAYQKLIKVLNQGGTITLKEVKVHSVLLGLRGVCDKLTIECDGKGTYNITIDEFKSQYWKGYYFQCAVYGLILFSHDAEILLGLPLEEKLRRLEEAGIKVERGALSLLRKIRKKIKIEPFIDEIVKQEGWVSCATIKRLYREGAFKGSEATTMPIAIPIYPPAKKISSLNVSIKINLIILTGKKSVFPIEFCRNNLLTQFGSSFRKAIEKRLKSLRRWHKTLLRGLYELEFLPYCKECGPNGVNCKYPEICLLHPPNRRNIQLHFSDKTGAVVKTGPSRVL